MQELQCWPQSHANTAYEMCIILVAFTRQYDTQNETGFLLCAPKFVWLSLRLPNERFNAPKQV